MAEPLVRIAGVDKTYDGEALVVAGLDVEIARGEFLTLLGPSGSGKTTTLMMLAGFETPTRGRITIDGRDITRVPPHRRGIGMVFQNYALFPHMTVAENVAFPLSVRGIGRADRDGQVAAALDMVQLTGLGARKPSQLSGGQQQRVALARALVFDPSLVLMDEPLGALDKQLREHMQYEIKSLHERLGITVVYVTHDQGEALTMSDRIAIFERGRIRQIADPETIYDRPDTVFVAEFIGETNRLPVTVERVEGERVVARTVDGRRLGARVGPGVEPGMSACIMIRPERLGVATGQDTENRLSACVKDVIYHGDHRRLHLACDHLGAIVARIPVRGGAARPGDVIDIGFSTDDAQALPAASH